MKARVVVTLKKSVLDPQGQAVGRALGALGFGEVKDVRLGKIIELDLTSDGLVEPARAQVVGEPLPDAPTDLERGSDRVDAQEVGPVRRERVLSA